MPLSSAPSSPIQNEALRLQALHALRILDTEPEPTFDEAVRVAASICGTPIALVNLLDGDRQWFKARLGMPEPEHPREHSFCNHAIGQTAPFIVPDATDDFRFAANPYVTKGNLRFYAGMPLNTTEGHTIGTLCVADTVPHEVTAEQIELLSALGRQVSAQIELRANVKLLAEVIANKEQVERELREQTLLFSAFMDHSPTTGFIKDNEGRFVYYNRMFCERFGVSPTEWIGKNVFELFPQEFAKSYHAMDMAVLDTGVSQMVEESSPGPGNTTLYLRTHKFRISDGSASGLLGGLSMDISHERRAAQELQESHAQLEMANQRLTELSQRDGLTGLHNRRAFDERLAREITEGRPFSLILVDIDHFKRLNDCHGHSAGDEVLRVMARLLNENFRVGDVVTRFGGEEFAVLLPATEMKQAFAVAERLRAAVANFTWRHRPVTLSAGVATWSPELSSAADLIDAADAALYCAKRSGRNCVEMADGSALVLDPYADIVCMPS